MKRQKILFFTGLFLVIVPLLGFPLWFRNLSMILAGIFVCVLSYLERGAVPFFRKHREETFDKPVLDIRPKDEMPADIIRRPNEKSTA